MRLHHRQVGDDRPVESRRLGVREELALAVTEDGVVIGHGDQRQRAPGADAAHHREVFPQVLELVQRALARRLDHRAVRHGVGEREAQLHQVRARPRQLGHEPLREAGVGVARHRVDHQRLALAGAQVRERALDARQPAGGGGVRGILGSYRHVEIR